MESIPRVGVAVIPIRAGRVLLGRRRSGSHGDGEWQFPGGHLEPFESVEECAVRELLEETGLEAASLEHGPWTNDIFPASGRHYLTVFMLARDVKGEPEVREPEKCHEWRWFEWDRLPEPLFLPIRNLLAKETAGPRWLATTRDAPED
jgi:8-oxo-dGTP diphosphatase